MFKKFVVFLSGLGIFAPMLALAQFGNTGSTSPSIIGSGGVLEDITDIINKIIPILIAIAVIIFIYGVITYVVASSPDDKAKGQQTMLYGIIGLFVIVSVWGLVAILNNTFEISQGDDLTDIPGVTI